MLLLQNYSFKYYCNLIISQKSFEPILTHAVLIIMKVLSSKSSCKAVETIFFDVSYYIINSTPGINLVDAWIQWHTDKDAPTDKKIKVNAITNKRRKKDFAVYSDHIFHGSIHHQSSIFYPNSDSLSILETFYLLFIYPDGIPLPMLRHKHKKSQEMYIHKFHFRWMYLVDRQHLKLYTKAMCNGLCKQYVLKLHMK